LLTESIRRRPYQILLFDEFEKAHRDIWNILLQLFDEGHLTDAHGRKVDFRNVIVIMTSNLGAQVISELPEHMKGSEPEATSAIMDIVRHSLSPELLNRIDETIIFHRLQREHMDAITELNIAEIAKRLEENQNMTLDVSGSAKCVLSEQGYDIRYGARPLKRVLNREVLNPLSRLVLEGAVKEGDIVRVRTRAEAEKEQKQHASSSSSSVLVSDKDLHKQDSGPLLGWVSSNPLSGNKNDVVIIRNHESPPAEDELDYEANEDDDDEQERLLDDPTWSVHK
jgi:ATP-dependent Clp protease ATP-binding subunit ClpA